MLQEEEIHLFDRNMVRSTGRGPSKSQLRKKDHAKQIKVAEEFINNCHNCQATVLEGKEARNPTGYLPKSRSSFKPPQKPKPKQFDTKKVPKRKIGLPSSDLSLLSSKINMAEEVIKGNCEEENIEQVEI